MVDEPLQLLDVDVRKEIGARREELTELDVGRAELLERMSKLAGAFASRRTVTPDTELAQHTQQTRSPGDSPNVQRPLQALCCDAHQGDISGALGLETRWLHALPREVVVDRLSMNAEDTADTHRIQSAAVNQAPDRFRVHAELVRNLANADEPRVSVSRRHRRLRRLARSSITRIRQANIGPPRATRRWARLAPNGSSWSHSLPPAQSARRRAKRAHSLSRSLRRRAARQARN